MRPEYIFHLRTQEEIFQKALDALIDGQAKAPVVAEAKEEAENCITEDLVKDAEAAHNNIPTDENLEEGIEEKKFPPTSEEVAFDKLKLRLEYDKNNFLSQAFAIWCFQVSLICFIIGE